MRAVTLAAVPAAPQVTEVETPRPLAGEVLVRWPRRAEGLRRRDRHRLPAGVDGAQVTFVIGKASQARSRSSARAFRYAAGEQVFGVVMKPFLGTGALGEYVTVPVAVGLARIPAGLGVAEAGALGLAGTAALTAIEASAPVRARAY